MLDLPVHIEAWFSECLSLDLIAVAVVGMVFDCRGSPYFLNYLRPLLSIVRIHLARGPHLQRETNEIAFNCDCRGQQFYVHHDPRVPQILEKALYPEL